MTMVKDTPITTQIESEQFLFVYSDWYGTYSELTNLNRITDIIGFCDCNDFMNFQIYRVCKNSVRPVDYVHALVGCQIDYYCEGENIATLWYEDH